MSQFMRTDVTAVKLYENYVFAGIGSFVYLYDKQSLNFLHKIRVLQGQKVYGFVPLDYGHKILVFGGKQFTVVVLKEETSSAVLEKLFDPVICDDWIHSMLWIDNDVVGLLTAHNVVQKWSTKTQSWISEHRSKDNSILYSGLLVRMQDDDLVVLAGTVFSEVIIHMCGKAAMHQLKGHRGVIFSISYDQEKELIVTTSDDRSVRIWHINNEIKLSKNTTGYWETADIVCLKEVYGHSARVMRNCIIDDYIISVGEDSVICYWDLKGSLLRKVATHQKGCIWSLDVDKDNLITGGGDGAVILHPLSIASYCGQNEELDINIDVPKKILFTARRNLVILNEASELIYYNFVTKTKLIYKLDHTSTYKLLSMSSCKQIIAVADMNGKLDIFIENCKDDSSLLNLIDVQLDVGKILSMHWAGNRHLVLCTGTGAITVIASRDNKTETVANFILPNCKERWLTAAAIDSSQNVFVVGDRCGNIHVYIKGQRDPVKTFNKVHGRYGPTTVNIKGNEIKSTGRDGTIKYFHINKDLSEIKYMNSKELEFQWVEKFLDVNENLVCGFQERVFVVYDIKSNVKLLEVPCGGGHRSWDAVRYIEKNNEKYSEKIKLIYLKNTELHLSTFDMSKIASTNIMNGSHAKNINCLKSFRSKLDNSVTFYIAGGEDTTLRISSVNAEMKFQDEIIFKQLSSVRTLKLYEIDDNDILVVSAGGRAQLCIKKLTFERTDVVKPKSEEIIDYLIKGVDKERKVNQDWRNASVDFDPETRIMDVDMIHIKNGNFLIFAGCSDSLLRVFLFTLEEKKLKPIKELKHHKTCILKTEHIKFYENDFIVTCTTRGGITFWIVNTDGEFDTKPVFTMTSNKSGINSFNSKILSEKQILIATGGDDNSIHLIVLNIVQEDLKINIEVEHRWSRDEFHCSQITGLILLDGILISTGIDQRITMFKWRVDDGGIVCDFARQVYSDVADIQGVDVVENDCDAVTVCVFGKGMEVIKLQKNI